MLKKHFKILHRSHTGRLRPHEHTSYLPLAVLLLFVGFCLTTFTASAATPYTGPEAGSIGISGTMPGKAPTVGAVIKTPVSGQSFADTPVVVSGTCPKDTLVEIFKNDIFAGSTPCTDSGTFSLEIDLIIGANTLTAKVYDSLSQEGPASNKVDVTYRPSQSSTQGLISLNFGGDQLLINTDAVFRGSFPKQDVNVPIDILGGRAPYAVNVQWGDSTNKVYSRTDNTTFQATHAYAKAGTYPLSIQATDADGRVAFLTVAVIVNGSPDAAAAATTTTQKTNLLLMLWPLYAAVFAMTLSFWVGEWREKRVLAKQGLLATS
jgi:hypothetical protein